MNQLEQHKAAIARFRECINTCDHALAEELIDSHAEFASLTSSETLYGGSGYLSVVELMRKSFSDIHWDIVSKIIRDVAAQGLAGLFAALDNQEAVS